MHKYHGTRIVFWLGLLIAASCGRAPEEAARGKAPDAPVRQTFAKIPTTDLIGRFEGQVYDLAFWSHATHPYQGGLFAANGDAGLVFITMEGATWPPVVGQFSGAIDVTYLIGTAQEPVSIVAGFDATTGHIRHFQVDSENKRVLPLGAVSLPANPAYAGFCFGADTTSATRWLMTLSRSGTVDVFTMARNAAGGLTFVPVARLDLAEGVTCTQDPRSRQFFVATKTGDIVTVTPQQGTQKWRQEAFFQMPVSTTSTLVDMGVSFRQDGQGELIILTQGHGGALAHAVDLRKADLRGRFALDAFGTVGAVTTARAFAVGSGNFGSLYRGGVLAIIDLEDTGEGSDSEKATGDGALKFAPLTAAALKLPLASGKALSLRKILQHAREDGTDRFVPNVQIPPITDIEFASGSLGD